MAPILNKVRQLFWQARAGTAAEEETPPAPLDEEALRRAIKRECQPFNVGGFRPTNDPLASVFGGIRVCLPDQHWPQGPEGPLLPICQLNLTEPSHLPPNLSDLKMIQLFVDPSRGFDPHGSTFDEDDAVPGAAPTHFAVRSYTSLDGLAQVTAPPMAHAIKPFEIAWDTPVPDFANHDVAGEVVDTIANDVYAYDWAEQVYRSKLGGWPATLQAEPWWGYRGPADMFDYALQIAQEPKSGWNIPGVMFLGRSKTAPRVWALDVQLD